MRELWSEFKVEGLLCIYLFRKYVEKVFFIIFGCLLNLFDRYL